MIIDNKLDQDNLIMLLDTVTSTGNARQAAEFANVVFQLREKVEKAQLAEQPAPVQGSETSNKSEKNTKGKKDKAGAYA